MTEERKPAHPLVLQWPEGSEIVAAAQHTDVMLGDRRVARIFDGVRHRFFPLFHVYSGFCITLMDGVFQVVASEPTFETYTTEHETYGNCTYEQAIYSANGWDKSAAWGDLLKRYEGRFESNPWKKKHNSTLWRWSRRIS